MCPGDVQDFPNYAQNMPKILSNLENITHWLTDWPSNMDPRDAGASKKLFLSFVIVMKNFIARKYIFGKSLIPEIQRMFRDAHCSVSISLIYFCAWLWLKENDLKISTKEAKHNTLGWRWHGDCCETPKWEKEGKIQFHWLSMQEQSR